MTDDESEQKPSHAEQLAKRRGERIDPRQFCVKFRPDLREQLEKLRTLAIEAQSSDPDTLVEVPEAIKTIAAGNIGLPTLMQWMTYIGRRIQQHREKLAAQELFDDISSTWASFNARLDDRSPGPRDPRPPFTLASKHRSRNDQQSSR